MIPLMGQPANISDPFEAFRRVQELRALELQNALAAQELQELQRQNAERARQLEEARQRSAKQIVSSDAPKAAPVEKEYQMYEPITRDLTGYGWMGLSKNEKILYLVGANAMGGLTLPAPQFDDFFGEDTTYDQSIEALDRFYADPSRRSMIGIVGLMSSRNIQRREQRIAKGLPPDANLKKRTLEDINGNSWAELTMPGKLAYVVSAQNMAFWSRNSDLIEAYMPPKATPQAVVVRMNTIYKDPSNALVPAMSALKVSVLLIHNRETEAEEELAAGRRSGEIDK